MIHAVGPIFGLHGGREGELLASAHRRSLEVADAEGCVSVAFPAISCGVHHFPVERAAPVALAAIVDHLAGPTRVELVRYVLFSPSDLATFEGALNTLAGADARIAVT